MKHQKQDRRVIVINTQTFSQEIQKFSKNEYKFASESSFNDMWLKVDFEDNDFEKSVINYIVKLLKDFHKPFNNLKIETHCFF
jgi:hypothetical protein